jgi:arginase family enzyme
LRIWNGRDALLKAIARYAEELHGLRERRQADETIFNKPLDIAVLGFPYDTSTSYRPGARFGPRGIRAGSSREKKGRSYNVQWGVDPFEEGLSIV